ncbi:MAG: MFS transporter [Acetobacteraceae bacterium]|nr:MFS transporter [Acetobacteraceae bacterium]
MRRLAPRARLGPLGVLGNVPFAVFWGGQTVSRVGDAVRYLALSWLAAEMTGSAAAASLVVTLGYLPWILLGPLAGVFLDRWNRRTVMIAADTARAALVALVPALGLLGRLALWHLYACAFLLSVCGLFFEGAAEAAVPKLLPRGQLMAANSLLQFSDMASRVAGPALGGALVAWVGAAPSLYADALSFLVSAGTVAAIAIPGARPESAAGGRLPAASAVWSELAEGWRCLRGDRPVFTSTLVLAAGNIAFGALSALYIFHMERVLCITAAQAGTALAVGSAVSAVVSLWAGGLRPTLDPAWLIMASAATVAIGFGMFALAGGVALLGASMAVITSGLSVAQIAITTLRQIRIPNQLLGRVRGTVRAFAWLMLPPSTWAAGLLAERFGTRPVLAVAGGVMFLTAVLAGCFGFSGGASRRASARSAAPPSGRSPAFRR